jgi:hypothetical protein
MSYSYTHLVVFYEDNIFCLPFSHLTMRAIGQRYDCKTKFLLVPADKEASGEGVVLQAVRPQEL